MNVPIDPHRFDVLFPKALPRSACGFKGFGFCGFCFAFFARRAVAAVAAVAASRAVATVTWGGPGQVPDRWMEEMHHQTDG